MNEQNKIPLRDLRNNLQLLMNYRNPDLAFQVLLIGFAHTKRHTTGWVGRLKRKGWMAPSMAHEFAQYVGYPIDLI